MVYFLFVTELFKGSEEVVRPGNRSAALQEVFISFGGSFTLQTHGGLASIVLELSLGW